MDQQLKDFFIQYNNRHKPLRVLLVDDDRVIQFATQRMFVICGFVIDVAYDGLQALDMVRSSFLKYDFIIMDIHMPNMDGIQVTRQVRKMPNYERVPVFALTGDMSMQAKLEVISAGMNEYFNKPIDIDSVLAMIKSYVA